MTRWIQLREYQELSVELGAEDARALAAVAGRRLEVRVGADGDHRLVAGAHVGTIVTPGLTVAIRPKVPLHNLFLMLGVAPPEMSGAPAGFESDPGLLSVMAAVFTVAVDRATGRGVLRDYRHTEERLLAPRGRIDLREQISRPGVPSPIACRFDEFTADVLPNRALLAATDRLQRIPGLSPDRRIGLRHIAQRFDEVVLAPPDVEAIEGWRPSPVNRHYETAMRLAAIILANLSLRDRFGSVRAASFTVNMNELFQSFLADRLRRALAPRITLTEEPRTPLAASGRMPMYPDLVFDSPAGRYVGDAKYKLSVGPARMHDYQQLLTYTTVMGLREGVLIYAQDPGDPEDPTEGNLVHSVEVKHAGTLLHTYRLPLAGSNADVEANIVRLADWITARTAIRNSSDARCLQMGSGGSA